MQKTFKALSDKTRREILRLLKKGPMTAGDIAGRFDMSFATISHHLSILKESDMVSDSKDGKYIIYELNSSVIDDLITYIYELKADKKNDE